MALVAILLTDVMAAALTDVKAETAAMFTALTDVKTETAAMFTALTDVKTDTALIRVLTDVMASLFVFVRTETAAMFTALTDVKAETAAMFTALTDVKADTALILVCNVAEVPALAKTPVPRTLLIEVIASLFVFVRTETAAIFVLLLPMLVAIVAERAVSCPVVATPDVEITRLALTLIPVPAVYSTESLNCAKVILVVPNTIVPCVLQTKAWAAPTVPS
jgi:hypothetical protein